MDSDSVATLGSLTDPVRRRLYEYVRDCDHAAGRDEAAAATGIRRTLAAYHLDKLVDAGLLRAAYTRPSGRSGPGAGRTAKIYSPTEQEMVVSVPPRDYGLLASLLVSSVERDDTGAVQDAVNRTAYDTGERLGADSDGNLLEVLSNCGYQPRTDGGGRVELCNCPFHTLSEGHRDIVCGLNLHLIRGILDSTGQQDAQAELAFRPNRCCVTIRNAQPAGAANQRPSPAGGENTDRTD
jgi:predicted ArsR family transcriptional regulator